MVGAENSIQLQETKESKARGTILLLQNFGHEVEHYHQSLKYLQYYNYNSVNFVWNEDVSVKVIKQQLREFCENLSMDNAPYYILAESYSCCLAIYLHKYLGKKISGTFLVGPYLEQQNDKDSSPRSLYKLPKLRQHLANKRFSKRLDFPVVFFTGNKESLSYYQQIDSLIQRNRMIYHLMILGADNNILQEKLFYQQQFWAAMETYLVKETLTLNPDK